MASVSAFTPTSSSSSSTSSFALLQKPSITARPSSILGLPSMAKTGKVKCSMEGKQAVAEESGSRLGMVGTSSFMAAAVAATMSNPAAMALVDDRMSTEGTGLPFGLSNNILGWILFGVFGLIWTFYIIYASGLDEDEESGLSL